MRNITTQVTGGKLVITIDIGAEALKAAKPSATGKTLVVASTGGNQAIDIGGGRTISIGVNAYVKPSI